MDDLVGFRFHPTDEEIIFLLGEKRRDPSITIHAIFETNIYDFEPPELSRLSPIQSDKKWCSFFTAPNYINPDRKRVCRATKTGYWKVTGEGYPIKDKHSKREIGFKRVLVFYERPGGSKEIKTNWVMHQFSATDSPLYKKDFVVCRVKKQGNKKRRSSSNVEGQQQKKLRASTNSQVQPSYNMTLDNGNLVAKNTSLKSHLPPINYLVSFRNHHHYAENLSPELQLPITENTPPGLPLSIIENSSPELQSPDVGNTFPELQLPVLGNTHPEMQLPVAENTHPELQLPVVENAHPKLQLPIINYTFPELQLPVVGNAVPQFQLPTAENTSLESQQLPSECLVYNIGHDAAENTLQVDPPQLATFNELKGCEGLVQSSFSAVHSPVSPFSIAWEEDNPSDVQGGYTSEERGESTLHFKSSKSIPGFCGGNRNETDTEFIEWVHNMFEYDNITSVNYNAILNY
ncbi:NAC domain-containing protein 86-like [Mangifera indica]|uniref:NAC domain-containing protein 86-like n=1 Tax=Mangifera indica TaxID=29780 RepID=UPI001CF98741|nr:NAC domain-containing protein 86-like [Mangifera indica]